MLSRIGFAGIMITLFGMSSVHASVVFDLASDWSDASNPNGVWAYREGENTLPHVANWTPLTAGIIQPAWSPLDTNPNFLPAWYKSVADNPVTGGIPLDVKAGDVVVHSTDLFRGPMGDANVIWTSPLNGTIDFGGEAWMLRDIGRENQWIVSLNGTELTRGTISSGDPFDRDNPFDFSDGSGGASALQDLAVSVGDTLRLDIVRTTSTGDFVGVNLTVTADDLIVPEPTTLLLLGIGLAGLGFAKRRLH